MYHNNIVLIDKGFVIVCYLIFIMLLCFNFEYTYFYIP